MIPFWRPVLREWLISQNLLSRYMSNRWIQKAIKHPGALRKQLGVKSGHTIPTNQLREAAKAPGTLGRRARLALTLRSFH